VPRKTLGWPSANGQKKSFINRRLTLGNHLNPLKMLLAGNGSIEPFAVFSVETGGYNKPLYYSGVRLE